MSEPLDLEPIKAREKASTPAPWRPHAAHDCWVEVRHGYGMGNRMIADCLGVADGAFVAHAREDVPALVAEVERLRDTLARIQRRARLALVSDDQRELAHDVVSISAAAIGDAS